MADLPSLPEGDSVFESVYQLPSIHDALADAAEGTLDALVKNPVIGAIPVVGSIRAAVGGVLAARDVLAIRKLVALMNGIGNVTEEDVAKWKQRLSTERGLRETGERVISVVESAASTTKAQMVGWVMRHYLDRRCDTDTMRRAVEMIGNAITEDLVALANAVAQAPPQPVVKVVVLEPHVTTRLGSVGLVYVNRGGIRPPEDESVVSPEAALLVRPAGG